MKPVDIQSLVRENVKQLTPYSSARDDFQGVGSVFLDANENPFNTPYNRYPDPHQLALRKKIAALKKTTPEQLFLGNGSDEPIDLLIRAFCEPYKDRVIIPEPTYGMYAVSAAVNGVEIRKIQLTPDFDLDVEAILEASDKRTRILFFCSPNNPSGNLLDMEKIRTILRKFQGLVVVDEAYIDFTDYPGFLPLLTEFNNLVVLQTFSKAWGLAGIRLGMCFSNTEVIDVLNKIKPPYNINAITQTVAMEYLNDESRKNGWVTEIRKQRELLKVKLSAVPLVTKVFPSDANFLFVRVTDAPKIYEALVKQGIVVRDRSNLILCQDGLRITVGTANENNQLLEALKKL